MRFKLQNMEVFRVASVNFDLGGGGSSDYIGEFEVPFSEPIYAV